jgi:hypothetical protein
MFAALVAVLTKVGPREVDATRTTTVRAAIIPWAAAEEPAGGYGVSRPSRWRAYST